MIETLASKGVNVAEIENQVQATEQKLLELDEKLENLPDLRLELVSLYQLEKEERLRKNEHLDFVKERAEENKEFFSGNKEENIENVNKEEMVAGRGR